jgi:predicted nucleic acid-binding protein
VSQRVIVDVSLLIAQAARRRIIRSARTVLDALIQADFRLSNALYRATLEAAGDA